MEKKILFIEICNYVDYPIGGHLSFAKQMLKSFGNQLCLVGSSADDTPTGKWIKKEIGGVTYDYFSVLKIKKSNIKPLIPARIRSFIALYRYRSKIFEHKFQNVFIQTFEVLLALNNQNLNNLCVRMPGVNNQLTISRYWYAKYFAKSLDFLLYKNLENAKLILASADKISIDYFVKRSKNIDLKNKIVQFPTRIDTEIFYSIPCSEARANLNLDFSGIIVTTTGRLGALKGWKFLIDSFMKFREFYNESILFFLGDGEDRQKIQDYIDAKNLTSVILLLGRLSHKEISMYLNASNIFIMGSYVEGWSTSLIEAIACAKPIVTTNFSSAKELVENGENGFVIETRDETSFSDAMKNCLYISEEELLNRANEIKRYSTNGLKENILKHWNLS